MNDELSKQKIDAVLTALDELIEGGPWDASNFLKVMNKNLRDIREKFINQVDSSGQEKARITSDLANRAASRSGQQQIYIALYSTDGTNIQSWERILFNLPRQMISRPIYADEEHVKAMIKTKDNKNNEAYVSVFVNQSDLLPMQPDKIPIDKLGNAMLILKDKSLKLDNINVFVHQSGVYHYASGRLTKNNVSD